MDLAAKKLAHEAEVAELGSKLAWVKPALATHVTYDETKDLHAYWPRRAEPSAEALARMDEISDRMTEISEILDAPDDGDDVEALEAEYNALDAEHDRLADTDLLIPEEDKPNVGTFLVLGKDGQPRLLETYYTAAKPARRPSASGEAVGDAEIEGEEPAPSASLPRSLEEQMAKDRRDVLALHIAHDPALALDLAIFSLARDHAGHFGYSDTGCTIRITDRNEPSGLTGIPASSALTELEQQRASLPNDWASEEDSFASFLAFRSLDDGVKAGWLAYAVSQSLKASLASGTHACTFQSRLGAEIGIDMAQHWRPGAELLRPHQEGADPQHPRAVRSRNRPALCGGQEDRTGDGCRAPVFGRHDHRAEIKAKALAWVPDVMRFDGVAGDPVEDGIAPDAELDGAEDLSARRGQSERCRRPAQPSGLTLNLEQPPNRSSFRARAGGGCKPRARLGSGGDHPMKPRHDIYATVTAQLVAAIESGAGEWRMPWHHSGAPVMRPTSVAGRRYSGINRLVLWATADACGYASGIWATYQQWRAHGGQVRKGEIGTHVILWKKVERGMPPLKRAAKATAAPASSRAASSSSTAIRSMAPRTRWRRRSRLSAPRSPMR
jgi:hypothetical protein